jgi:hypothetical protein
VTCGRQRGNGQRPPAWGISILGVVNSTTPLTITREDYDLVLIRAQQSIEYVATQSFPSRLSIKSRDAVKITCQNLPL